MTSQDILRLTAGALLSVTYLAALGIAADIYITQGTAASIPNLVAAILGSGIGVCLNIVGIHQGVQLNKGATNASTSTT